MKVVAVDIAWVSAHTLTEMTLLGLAFLLSATVGLERHRSLKSAGLRTHALVGVGSAVFTLVSAYGFDTVTAQDAIVDPSRIAAQVVSGIGFLGAGVIFVRQNTVAGLTTAASIWVSASIGMACGAGMPALALSATLLHLLAVWSLGKLGNRIRPQRASTVVKIGYREGRGALRTLLTLSATTGFEAIVAETRDISKTGKPVRYQARVTLRNPTGKSPHELIEAISEIPGVLFVRVVDATTD
ncbi:MgtC/SapB family protein [Microbacterium sp. 179-I 3D2 NHS]|uniref:MgtC/SapB family protein n=1 Tax=Microbacterium sp. 179-I 3D2 NHS TaxID=3235178 RepID=UPI0039A23DAA